MSATRSSFNYEVMTRSKYSVDSPVNQEAPKGDSVFVVLQFLIMRLLARLHSAIINTSQIEILHLLIWYN